VLKAGHWKLSYGSIEKGKRKGNSVPMTRSYLYLFLSHRHVVLSRGTQWNRGKLSEYSNLLQILLFPPVSAWSDISDQLGLFHRIPEAWQPAQVRHIRPQVRYIWPAEFIQPPSGSKAVAAAPIGYVRPQVRYIWPTRFIRASSGSSIVSPPLIGYIRPSRSWANLNSPSDISDLGRIYPMFWHLQR
jgi:hypothetical protein